MFLLNKAMNLDINTNGIADDWEQFFSSGNINHEFSIDATLNCQKLKSTGGSGSGFRYVGMDYDHLIPVTVGDVIKVEFDFYTEANINIGIGATLYNSSGVAIDESEDNTSSLNTWSTKTHQFTVPSGTSYITPYYYLYVTASNIVGNLFVKNAEVYINNVKLPTPINIPTINGLTVPVKGEIPAITITETDQFNGTVSWSPNNNLFLASTIYTAAITLTPKDGFTLSGVPEDFFTVSGATVSNDADSGVITAIYPITESEPVIPDPEPDPEPEPEPEVPQEPSFYPESEPMINHFKPIRIMTPELWLLGEIDDYESFTATYRYHAPGEFELVINLNKQSTNLLQKNNVIMLGADPKKVHIIKHRNFIQENDETLTVRGYTLSGITRQRRTIPPTGQAYDRLTANAETIMKTYIDHNCINPSNPDRVFSMLINNENLERGPSLPWQTRLKNLADELESISRTTGIGWQISIDLDLEKWIFDVYEGKDLTSGQEINPPVIFSVEFDNVESQEYTDSLIGHANIAYVAGKGEGTDRVIVEVGSESGLDRYEEFVDARDIGVGEEESPPSPEEIEARLIARGEQKLAELIAAEAFECEISNSGSFKYNEDWSLGDIVTIQNKKWGLSMDARITEVIEIYEPDGFKLRAVFGNKLPTLTEKLKSKLENANIETTR